jgi:hypothetical protein
MKYYDEYDVEYTFDGQRWWRVEDNFAQETVWEQLRVIAWISFSTLGILAMILSVAL